MEKEEEAARCLRFLVDRIHTTVLATIGSDGYPHTCAVDMMYFDAEGAYFLTARGKNLYRRLSHNLRVSLTGVRGEDTMSSVAVSLVGDVEEVGPSYLEVLLEANPYMYDIYPTNESRSALTIFRIRRGRGEWFDLSKRPVERVNFCFGDFTGGDDGYVITEACTGCGRCLEVCPQSCIDTCVIPYIITDRNCLRCGNCMEICPSGAVVRRMR